MIAFSKYLLSTQNTSDTIPEAGDIVRNKTDKYLYSMEGEQSVGKKIKTGCNFR